MKKILAFLLAMLTVLSLASCEADLESILNGILGEQTGPGNQGGGEFIEGGGDIIVGGEETDKENTTPVYPWNDVETITIAKALELCGEPGNITTDRYYIKATVDKITSADYGSMQISDSTGTISVYGTWSADGEAQFSTLTAKPGKGDEVLLHCILQNYNGTKEVKNARLIDFKKNETAFNPADYTPATIAQAREAKVGDKLTVTGVVAQITYANGKKPNGVMLIDDTASIYVFDSYIAGSVTVGNTVKIAGEKDMWILDTETNLAAKFGYKGSCQIANAALLENDGKVSDFNKSWITETTVKDILDTPISENITSTVYKVVCRVSKVPGDGFVNYYFNDLDYINAENTGTGSYTYTQCNGGDFAWLDQYDGKICTVYLTALNAKSTNAGCVFRFLPVSVEPIENFTFPAENVPAHVLKYYGADQFLASYTGNPALELITSVSSPLLGFENAALSYSSDNESVVRIDTADGKTVMNCLSDGVANLTISATYNGITKSQTVAINVKTAAAVDYITVKEAIEAESNTTVTVKGIVGAALVNQTGFYLIDSTGAIAVRVEAAVLEELKTGYEVIMTGTRTVSKDGGQICINSATIAANSYGSHDYSTESFITGKTIAEVKGMADSVAQTANIYVLSGTVKKVESYYSTNYYVTDGTVDILLYSGNGSQYSWLAEFIGETVTFELNTCDWNAKGLKGCVLSVTTQGGEKTVNKVNP